ncbi:hypothetical protein BDV41DRAFT_536554 [Aspergillus transmontanensis]|uniref:Uncharacterized protein n=1 Tax=Aspergillus transmontanensis TaxID=1034304 RepID=A0A5N6VXT1_9EURO|nr:hypothetical protein BDV41DRAFT_536554 [Aspergillus transmontanensis]
MVLLCTQSPYLLEFGRFCLASYYLSAYHCVHQHTYSLYGQPQTQKPSCLPEERQKIKRK